LENSGKENSIKIAFTGGGTGGHIYPALAVAQELIEKYNADIFYIGSASGMDKSIVEGAGVRFYGIAAGKLRRYFSLKNIFDIYNIIKGFLQAKNILKKERPLLLFSKGGFVSVPPVFAASSLSIPVWTHESDFSPGLATKINALAADRIYISYQQTLEFFKREGQKKIVYAGNPVREIFREASAQRGRDFLKVDTNKKILLVLGGSQGAKEINDLVLECLPELVKHFFVVHQTGKDSGVLGAEPLGGGVAEGPRSGAEARGGLPPTDSYIATAYIKEQLPDILASASLVMGRSGAGTVWEAAATGRPMLLIPLCGSGTRGDQVENARYFVEKGAAVMLLHPTGEVLINEINKLVYDKTLLINMAAASKIIGENNAVKKICADIVLFLGERDAACRS
jgi:UDP-N-acetylglucosamine--N-acetylmuramyl-(pentapeptide) pyrophosphoryl-undecaprenol N-acetylglucosamine transferase